LKGKRNRKCIKAVVGREIRGTGKLLEKLQSSGLFKKHQLS